MASHWRSNAQGWSSGDKFEKPADSDIKRHLQEMSKKYDMDNPDMIMDVTQTDATERPRTGKYDANFNPGIYVDPVSGEPLYSSDDKFSAHCGWPAFSKAIAEDALTTKTDTSHGMKRVEMRSRHADSHLGHVFEDGPPEMGGMRHCVNSAATIFIPYDKMDQEGYSDWKSKVTKGL
eukprot:CAMPEP_0119300228 /NCGR_PEP_ID=MMETSP1333-20130426/2208_1 /TAXON_ID=418940 /ORGANISM="Scyphosphaera apsteinii, Strain RCC1455" /LENGTH=176 /DNA_ID=CAMNT_0007301933 /DNA_START=119 /DNA_END=649 /DNA_ORIENTATION=-